MIRRHLASPPERLTREQRRDLSDPLKNAIAAKHIYDEARVRTTLYPAPKLIDVSPRDCPVEPPAA